MAHTHTHTHTHAHTRTQGGEEDEDEEEPYVGEDDGKVGERWVVRPAGLSL